MRITSWIFLIVVLALLGALGGGLLSTTESDPRELYESARRSRARNDHAGAIQELDFALRVAETQGDQELIAEVLLERGYCLGVLEAYGPAMADYRRVLEYHNPNDPAVDRNIAELDEKMGNLDAALERIAEVCYREPEDADAWAVRGRILARLANDRIAECSALLHSDLTDDDAKEAMALVMRATGMDPADPLRISLVYSVRSMFAPSDQQQARQVLRLVDEASEYNAEARTALVQSFGNLKRQAALVYLQLLHRSGRTQDAIDFGMAAVSRGIINRYRVFMEAFAHVLLEAERPAAAANMIQQHFDRAIVPSQDFYAVWAQALYESERWRELWWVGKQLWASSSKESPFVPISQFYRGWYLYQVNNYKDAAVFFGRFVRQEDPIEPHPGAMAQAWRAQADCYRNLMETDNEYAALITVTRLDPSGDGHDWLRLYELTREGQPDAYEPAEEFLTHAMRLMPEREDELLPLWMEHGKRGLQASGTDLSLERRSMQQEGLTTPTARTGPYQVYELARMHNEEGEHLAAITGCKLILAQFPGFLPAIDLHADASFELGEYRTAAGLWFERLRTAGRDSATLERLQALPDGVLEGEQLLEMMRIDPHNTGRLHVARTLRAEEQPHAALAGLSALDLEPLGDEGHLLAAELMIETERYDEALLVLQNIDPHSDEGAHVLALSLTAAMEIGDAERIDAVLSRVSEATVAEPEKLLDVADSMLLSGDVSEARLLLEALDARKELRSGEVLLRLAVTGLLQDDVQLTLDSLERAEAFVPASVTATGRLILAVQRKQWSRLPLLVRALVQSQSRLTRNQDVVLAILDERVDQAERELRDALVFDTDEPLWPLLDLVVETLRGKPLAVPGAHGPENASETSFTVHGSSSGARDVRPLLAHLLALESDEWRVWAVADLARIQPPTPGSLWASFLSARGLLALGNVLATERKLRTINETWPSFAPAWDLHEETKLERLGSFDHVDLVRLREDRRKALGPRPGEEAEALLTAAWSLEAGGAIQRALNRVRNAVNLDPTLEPAWVKLGQLLRDTGDTLGAVDAWQIATRQTAVRSDSPVVAEFVGALLEAHASDPLQVSSARVHSELTELMSRFQNDPLIALELARAELDNPGVNQATGIARAYDRLDRFRLRTRDVPIEHLRTGSTAKWKSFYQSLEPRRAGQFLHGELLLRPGDIDLWHMLGEVLDAEGRRTEAIELYESIQSMVPDGETRRAIAALLASSGADPALVQQHIEGAMELEGREAPDVDMLVIEARAMINGSSAQMDRGIQILERVWDQREGAIGRYDAIDIAQLYGTALVQRGDFKDRELATELLEGIVQEIADQPRKHFVTAMAKLAATMRR